MQIIKPNKLGWVTSCSINNSYDLINVTTWNDKQPQFLRGLQYLTGSIEFTAANPGAVLELIQDWMSNGISKPTFQKEYMCLYCGSPNSIELTHCKKCGAPRSFVLG